MKNNLVSCLPAKMLYSCMLLDIRFDFCIERKMSSSLRSLWESSHSEDAIFLHIIVSIHRAIAPDS